MIVPKSQLHITLCLCAGLFLSSFAVFASLSSSALINGDTALYQQQIVNLDFTQRTVHLGYYLLGSPFIHLLPLSPDYAINLMNCFLGALCIVLMYLIALTLVQSHRVAFFSAIVLSTNYLFVINAVYAEVYLPQLFFFLLALQFVLLQKAIPAGAAFALSFLVTPSALFGLPCLLLMQRDKRAIAHLTITAFIIVMIVLFPNLNDYFSGGRGLIKAVSSNLTIKDALVKEGREISMSLAWYAPLFLAGGVSLMNNNRLHRFGVALFSLWFFSFIFGEKFADVPVQLPAYALLSLVIGLGSNYLLTVSTKRNRLLFSTVFLFIMLCISITGFISFRRTAETTCNLNQYRDSALEINRQSHPEYLVVGDWSKGILFEHYVFQRSYTGVWINTEWLYGDWGDRIQEDSRKKFKEAIASGREIWFLGNEFSLFSELYHHGYHIELFKNFYRATVPTPKD